MAGGGPEGAVYEIGALRALEEAIEGLDFTEVDIYVGVSAGSFIAASLANGLSPTQMARALVKHEPGEHPFVPAVFFTPAYREWARRSLMLPKLVSDALWRLTTQPGDQTLLESLTRLTRALPVGIFDNEPIRRYLERMFSIKGRTDDFRKLRHKLIVVSADLESGRAIRFGKPGLDRVPISRAVQASTALPGVYPPVPIDGRLCVDGVLLKTVHASVALDEGVGLLFCLNPLVPADIAAAEGAGEHLTGTLVKRGLPSVLSQTFRTLIHSRLEVGMAAYETRYPGADVVLFEPGRDEYKMFFTNIFSFSSRRKVCQLAYEVTRKDLYRRRKALKPILARHGLRLREEILGKPRNLWRGVGLPVVEYGSTSARQLERALEELEEAVG
ncbi:MAG: patatin-like phospholipase family protein [Gemmatimonadales bacterium]